MMKRILLAAAMFAATTIQGFSQESQPAPAAKITLEFDAQQIQWLSAAINELPKKIADPFLADLQRQMTDKQKAAEAAKPKVPETPAAKK